MILYKYIPFESGLNILKSKTLGFSQANFFNDPFDLPYYPKEVSENVSESVPNDIHFKIKENILIENSGILSLTRNPANILMWAHYASMHYGMVIGIDVIAAGLTDENTNFIPAQFGDVKYTSTRNERNFLTKPANGMAIGETHHFMPDHYEKTSRVFLNKSLEWSYEEEVRVIKCLNGISQSGKTETPSGTFEILNNSNRAIYLFSVPSHSFTEVFLGARCSETDTEKVRRLKKVELPDLKIKTTKLMMSDFSLKFSDLSAY